MRDAIDRLCNVGWFEHPGVHCVVGGLYGSEGKGVAASLLEYAFRARHGSKPLYAETNAGPNSGHTAYVKGHKVVTQQLPVSAVQSTRNGFESWAHLNAGAIIDMDKLIEETKKFGMSGKVAVHPNAVIIAPKHRDQEATGGPAKIASTGKGVGAALADKVMRSAATAKEFGYTLAASGISVLRQLPEYHSHALILETAQGFSLGINQRFYPHSTSRECTVMQALSDACMHPVHLRKTLMCVRTFPIRVGNTDQGHSGECYSDQRELTWSEIGVEPEYTTVTKRVRRVFSWSRQQFRDALAANRPDVIFCNFMNYLNKGIDEPFCEHLINDYVAVMGRRPEALILGWGKETEGVTLWPT